MSALLLPLFLISTIKFAQSAQDVTCHEFCTCSEGSVDCSYANFKSIPEGLPSNMTNLDASGNRLKEITGISFRGLSELKHMNLSNNILSHIDPPSFQIVRYLNSLDLSHNFLSSLHPGIFSGLTYLKHINISNNLLYLHKIKLQERDFKKLNLESLDLSSNNLTDLSDDILKFIRSVRTLRLNYNNFGYLKLSSVKEFMSEIKRQRFLTDLHIEYNLRELSFDDNFFEDSHLNTLSLRGSHITNLHFMQEVVAVIVDLSDNPLHLTTLKINNLLLQNCQELYLSNVGLKTMDVSFLKAFTNLQVLDLSQNLFILLDGQPFFGMQFIERLDLSQNTYMSELSIDFGKNLTSLTHLNLSSCALQYVEPAIIIELPSLSVLDLSYNSFQTFPDSYKSIFTDVHVNMSHNPLHCNCEMLWLANWRKSQVYRTREVSEFVCFSPTKQPISEMKLSDFKCSKPIIFNITQNATYVEGSNDVMFHCGAEADPPPSVTWKTPFGSKQSNQPSANRTRNVMFGYLKLSPLKKSEHEGWYECEAENLLGKASARTFLRILDEEVVIINEVFTSTQEAPDPQSPKLSTPMMLTSTNPFVDESFGENTLSRSTLSKSDSHFFPKTFSSTLSPSIIISHNFTMPTSSVHFVPIVPNLVTNTTNSSTVVSSILQTLSPELSTTTAVPTTTATTTTTSTTTTTRPTTTSTTTTTRPTTTSTTTTTRPTTTSPTTTSTSKITTRTVVMSTIAVATRQQSAPFKPSVSFPYVETSKHVTDTTYVIDRRNITMPSKGLLSSWENKVAILVATAIACILVIALVTVLVVILLRKRHRRRKYLLGKKNAFLKTYPTNGSFPRRMRSNSGMMTTPLNNTLDRPKNGFDILLAKEKGLY